MHVLMISTDTTFLTGEIGNARARHEAYAQQANARISVVICNRRKIDREPFEAYESARLVARPTHSGSYFAYLLAGFRAGMQFARERPVDVITSQDPFLTALIGLALRARLRVPLIVQDHSCFVGSRYFVLERPRNRWLRLIATFTLPLANAVRVVNRRERLACIRLGVKAPRVCVVPVGTDIRRFMQPAAPEAIAAWRTRLNLESDAAVILWVGRPVAFKNLPLLLQTFRRVHAELPRARLVLAGDMDGTNVIGQAAALGLSDVVRFPGPVAYDDLPPLYQMANVYALTSNYEGLGRVLVEASAAGLPCVSTDNNGANDVILDGVTGLIVPVGDSEKMAAALLDMLRHPTRAQAMSKRARQHVQVNFDEADLTARWIDMWRRVSARQPPCAS